MVEKRGLLDPIKSRSPCSKGFFLIIIYSFVLFKLLFIPNIKAKVSNKRIITAKVAVKVKDKLKRGIAKW